MANVANLVYVICKVDLDRHTKDVPDAAEFPRVPIGQPKNISGQQAEAPSASGIGSSAGTAAGEVVGDADGIGSSTSIAGGSHQGEAHGQGIAIGAAFSAMAPGRGELAGTAAGALVGDADGLGTSSGTASARVIGAAHGEGRSEAFAAGFYPHYTDWEAEERLFTFAGANINEVDAAFEQAGRVVVAAERTIQGQPEIWIYWFNPTRAAFVFERLGFGRNPRLILDDPFDTTNSDVLLFYITWPDQRLVYRQQRDRYEIIYETTIQKVKASYVDLYLQDVVKTRDGRLYIVVAWHDIASGKYSYDFLESALYPIPMDVEAIQALYPTLTGGDLHSLINEILLERDAHQALYPTFLSGLFQQPIRDAGPETGLSPFGNPYEWLVERHAIQALYPVFQSGSLPVVFIDHILYDIDAFRPAHPVLQSGSVVQVVIDVTLEVEAFTPLSPTFLSAGSSLV